MEYIRNVKSEKDYPSNTRHCLYGLDADLIMLGLLSHEPHFCLLREEVTFGRSQKGPKTHAQTFHLLHLSVMREYLGYEFEDLQTKIDFEYDFERILDDYVLMCYFVG
jgi:5'-3' exoribonuclease 1